MSIDKKHRQNICVAFVRVRVFSATRREKKPKFKKEVGWPNKITYAQWAVRLVHSIIAWLNQNNGTKCSKTWYKGVVEAYDGIHLTKGWRKNDL